MGLAALDTTLQGTLMPEFTKTVPMMRIFDVAKAKEFHVDFLGFQVD